MEKARNLEDRAAIEENDRDEAREDEDANEDNGKADQIQYIVNLFGNAY